jgi:hypothetical protein
MGIEPCYVSIFIFITTRTLMFHFLGAFVWRMARMKAVSVVTVAEILWALLIGAFVVNLNTYEKQDKRQSRVFIEQRSSERNQPIGVVVFLSIRHHDNQRHTLA